MSGMASFTPGQGWFRFYENDGSQATCTALAASNTNITRATSTPQLILGILVYEFGGASGATTDDWQLQVSKNGGAYADVSTASSNLKAFNSAHLTDGATGTQTFRSAAVGSGNYKVSEDGLLDDFQIAASTTVEMWFSIELVTADLANNDTLDFRLLYNGATFAYDVTPRITVSAGPNLSPSLFTNTQTFHSPTVTRGAVGLTPSLFTNTQTFYSPTVAQVTYLVPSLFTNTQTFHSPTVTQGAVNLQPNLFTNTQTFHSPTIAPGAINLSPSLVTNTQTFYGPTVTFTYSLAPELYTNTNTFYSPTVTYTYGLTPDLFTNTQTFYSPAVSQGSQVLAPALFTNTNDFFFETGSNLITNGTFDSDITGWTAGTSAGSTPNVSWSSGKIRVERVDGTAYQYARQDISPGGQPLDTFTASVDFVNPDGVTVLLAALDGNFSDYQYSTEASGTLSVTMLPSGTFIAIGIDANSGSVGDAVEFDNVTFYAAPNASISQIYSLTPSLFTNDQTFYSPTISVGAVTLTPSLFTNDQTFYSPTVSVGAVTLSPALFTNTQTFYSPTVGAGVSEIFPPVVTNTTVFYGPTVSVTYGLTPGLFTNTQTFYSPTITTSNTIVVPLVTNDNTFYSLSIAGGGYTIAPELFVNTNIFYSPTVIDHMGNRAGRGLGQPMIPNSKSRLNIRFGRRR